MGPTFVEFGSIAGKPGRSHCRKPILAALARLQDKVKPFPYEQVEEIVTSPNWACCDVQGIFSASNRSNSRAASLGQVHFGGPARRTLVRW